MWLWEWVAEFQPSLRDLNQFGVHPALKRRAILDCPSGTSRQARCENHAHTPARRASRDTPGVSLVPDVHLARKLFHKAFHLQSKQGHGDRGTWQPACPDDFIIAAFLRDAQCLQKLLFVL